MAYEIKSSHAMSAQTLPLCKSACFWRFLIFLRFTATMIGSQIHMLCFRCLLVANRTARHHSLAMNHCGWSQQILNTNLQSFDLGDYLQCWPAESSLWPINIKIRCALYYSALKPTCHTLMQRNNISSSIVGSHRTHLLFNPHINNRFVLLFNFSTLSISRFSGQKFRSCAVQLNFHKFSNFQNFILFQMHHPVDHRKSFSTAWP